MVKTTIMKTIKALRYVMILTVLFLSFSCDNDDSTVDIEAPSNILAEAGYGEAIFTWNFPEDDMVEYIRVEYIDSECNPKKQKNIEFT